MNDLEKAKKRLVNNYRKNKYAANEKIIEAFMKVPREDFVPESQRNKVYQDTPLPVLKGQTISAPHMCVLILSYGDLQEGQKVLEIGTGTGYQAALISEMVGETGFVYGIERHQELAEFGMKNLEKAGYRDRVFVIAGDGTLGWPDENVPPFDRVIITAAGPIIPPPLIDQLKIGGKLYMPLGEVYMYQSWIEVEKTSDTDYDKRTLTSVAFVPLIGEFGVQG